MPRREAGLDDEKRSYGALWLLCSLLLFVGALWAIADDNVFRRPWKKYQAGFSRLEIRRIEETIHVEQAQLLANFRDAAIGKVIVGTLLQGCTFRLKHVGPHEVQRDFLVIDFRTHHLA